MQQRTEEWQQWRERGIGASLAPGVMGVNPWFPRTPYEVFLLLTKRVGPPDQTDAMRRGLALEEPARRAFEAHTGLIIEPRTLEHAQYSFLRASLDGITLDGTEIVELKVPGRATFEAIRTAREVPPHYYWQIQQQLAVSGAERGHFWAYCPGEDGILISVGPNVDAIERLIARANEVWTGVQTDTPPPLIDRDTIVRSDREWLAIAEEYRKTEAVVSEWTKKLEAVRRALIGLTNGAARVEGGGIIATRYARQGTIDYKAIVQERLANVDVAPYRRSGGEQVRVTVSQTKGGAPRQQADPPEDSRLDEALSGGAGTDGVPASAVGPARLPAA
jgi:putative phage-type endonuclease